jgi:hypothetical protein
MRIQLSSKLFIAGAVPIVIGWLIHGQFVATPADTLASGMHRCANVACPVSSDRPGIVFVGEEFDPADAFRLTGRFTAHWEEVDGDGHIAGPRGVGLEEALSWGRQMARVVLVCLGDDDEEFSAGEDAPDEDVRLWPAGGLTVRSRPYGAALDGSVQRIKWKLESVVQTAERRSLPVGVVPELENDPELENVAVEPMGDGVWGVAYIVGATGSVEAMQLGGAMLRRALKRLDSQAGMNTAQITSTSVVSPLDPR